MATQASGGVRHSILDLAPLELECMNALWPRGEATVRDIQAALMTVCPRAYTTIMTILDRLAQKGVVQRRKSGRAWVYSANVSEQDARSRAVAQLVDGFFDGSAEALSAHLASHVSGAVASGARSGAGLPVRAAQIPTRTDQIDRKGDVAAPDSPEPGSAELETTLL